MFLTVLLNFNARSVMNDLVKPMEYTCKIVVPLQCYCVVATKLTPIFACIAKVTRSVYSLVTHYFWQVALY